MNANIVRRDRESGSQPGLKECSGSQYNFNCPIFIFKAHIMKVNKAMNKKNEQMKKNKKIGIVLSRHGYFI